MGNDDIEVYQRRVEPGNGKEKTFVTLAALVSLSALAWGISGAWVGFRDGVNRELLACTYKHESILALVQQHYREGDIRLQRLVDAETRSDKLAERLQAALDRIRDLELGKRP
jgi:hypothetical protein